MGKGKGRFPVFWPDQDHNVNFGPVFSVDRYIIINKMGPTYIIIIYDYLFLHINEIKLKFR